jgi:hypothetical protein
LLLAARPAEIVGAIPLRLLRLPARNGAVELRLCVAGRFPRTGAAREIAARRDRRCRQRQDRA